MKEKVKEGGKRKKIRREEGRIRHKEEYRVWLLSVLSGRIFFPEYQRLAQRPRCSFLPQFLGGVVVSIYLMAASPDPHLCPD